MNYTNARDEFVHPWDLGKSLIGGGGGGISPEQTKVGKSTEPPPVSPLLPDDIGEWLQQNATHTPLFHELT